jgi:hypothetical protein
MSLLKISIIIFIAIFNFGFTHKNDASVVIFVKGSGGDKNGSLLLEQYLIKKNIKTQIVDNINYKETDNNITHYLIVGQGAVLDFMQNYSKESFKSKIFLYSHIISPDILSFIQKHKDIILITTKSEINLSKNIKNLNIIDLPLAIPTYLKSESQISYHKNKEKIDKILQYPTIHLGGSYKDPSGNNVLIADSQFENIKKELKIKNSVKVSIIVHPRTFADIIEDNNAIKNRLIAIANKNGIQNTYFFVNTKLYDIISKNIIFFKDFNISESPEYSGVLYALNELKNNKKQYVSVDQYNAFSDIKNHVIGFLLNKNDINQLAYLENYNKLKLDNNILQNFLFILK